MSAHTITEKAGTDTAGTDKPGTNKAGPDEAPRSANARRVARHRARLEAAGLKQVNIQAPVSAHPILKELGTRLKLGQPIEEVLFELAATHARQPKPAATARPAPTNTPQPSEAASGLTGRLGRLLRGRSGRDDDGSN